MSRIGNTPVTLPSGLTAEIKPGQITIKSPKAELITVIPEGITVKLKDDQIIVTRSSDSKKHKSLHGLIRSLIANMVIGLTKGFEKVLELQGTGYRVNPKGEGIELSLGFSHLVEFTPPAGVKLEVKDQKFITITGADKHLVGQTAAKIRQLKTPDAYKGKGIRYQGEVVKLKPGKAAKSAGEGA